MTRILASLLAVVCTLIPVGVIAQPDDGTILSRDPVLLPDDAPDAARTALDGVILERVIYSSAGLEVEGYDPDRMDYKLLLNPLYPTAVFGDDDTIHAVAMAADFTPVDSYTRPVPGTREMLHERIARAIFPFEITLQDPALYADYLDDVANDGDIDGLLGAFTNNGQDDLGAWLSAHEMDRLV